MPRRRMTFEQATEYGHSLPASLWRNRYTGRPMLTRTEWEQLGRLRRVHDVLFGVQPPKDDPMEYRPRD